MPKTLTSARRMAQRSKLAIAAVIVAGSGGFAAGHAIAGNDTASPTSPDFNPAQFEPESGQFVPPPDQPNPEDQSPDGRTSSGSHSDANQSDV